jgi:hypothetical protein
VQVRDGRAFLHGTHNNKKGAACAGGTMFSRPYDSENNETPALTAPVSEQVQAPFQQDFAAQPLNAAKPLSLFS